MRTAVCVVLVASACSVVENEPVPDPASTLDEKVFRCNVEPILVRQCSYTACHGIADAALRVYSPGKLRAAVPPDLDTAIAPLTEAEHHANFASAAGFAFRATKPENNFLLRKPLAAQNGGYEHAGGAIWPGTGDPQFVAIYDWLSNRGVCK